MKRAYPSTFAGISRRAAVLLTLAAMAMRESASGHQAGEEKRLPVIAPAPPFALTSQDGRTVTLAGLRGKVLAVTFIYTSCPDICPLLTEKMAQVQDDLGPNFGSKVVFVSITLDPEHDTSQVLKDYAQLFGAKPEGWVFLTGPLEVIRDVTRQYGVFFDKTPDGSVDHTQLTTLIDADGQMRVQYLGARFDPEEFEHDLTSLIEKE
jgi:protein SCO1/2